jgi:uronate dehydrogenase
VASLPASRTSHVVTTAALLDAMVVHDVTRMVYAGSTHAVGRTPRRDLVTADARPRPDTFYGVGKVAAEAVMSLYADRYGIDAVSCRIGSFLPQPETLRNLSTWLSHDDCVRMVEAALTAPAPGFAVLYGISANTRAWWDLEPGRTLGYEPQDDAEEFAGQVAPRGEDEREAAYVGGPFALEQFYRPALDRS